MTFNDMVKRYRDKNNGISKIFTRMCEDPSIPHDFKWGIALGWVGHIGDDEQWFDTKEEAYIHAWDEYLKEKKEGTWSVYGYEPDDVSTSPIRVQLVDRYVLENCYDICPEDYEIKEYGWNTIYNSRVVREYRQRLKEQAESQNGYSQSSYPESHDELDATPYIHELTDYLQYNLNANSVTSGMSESRESTTVARFPGCSVEVLYRPDSTTIYYMLTFTYDDGRVEYDLGESVQETKSKIEEYISRW